ncbi:hypothetical protein NSQ26_09635 [Bacillus sp. FSL W7-1360]
MSIGENYGFKRIEASNYRDLNKKIWSFMADSRINIVELDIKMPDGAATAEIIYKEMM